MKVIPTDINDKEKSEVLQKIWNHHFEKYEGVTEVLVRIQLTLPTLYGAEVHIPDNMITELMEEIIKLDTNENN